MVFRAVVTATQALMLLRYCEAREGDESRQRAEGWRRRREVKVKRSDGGKPLRIKIYRKYRRGLFL